MIDQWLVAGSLSPPTARTGSTPGTRSWSVWMVGAFSGDFLIADQPARDRPARVGDRQPRFRGRAVPAVGSPLRVAAARQPRRVRPSDGRRNDVSVAALFVSCVGYGLRYARAGRAADLGRWGRRGGRLGGTKYYALGYSAVALVAAVGLAAVAPGSGQAVHPWWSWAAVRCRWVAPGISVNALVSGRPLYPLGGAGGNVVLEVVPTSGLPASSATAAPGLAPGRLGGLEGVRACLLGAAGARAGECRLVGRAVSRGCLPRQGLQRRPPRPPGSRRGRRRGLRGLAGHPARG